MKCVCCKCGLRRTCESVEMDLKFPRSVRRKSVRLCRVCTQDIRDGDSLRYGLLSYSNLLLAKAIIPDRPSEGNDSKLPRRRFTLQRLANGDIVLHHDGNSYIPDWGSSDV